jgi:hypothetical protein
VACGQKYFLLYIASSVTNRKQPDLAAGRASHYSYVFEDSLSTQPVQEGHRKTDWPSQKHCFLYDVGHNHYKNMVKEAEAWRDIAKEVNKDSMYYFFINYFIFAHYLLLKIHSKISIKNWQNT